MVIEMITVAAKVTDNLTATAKVRAKVTVTGKATATSRFLLLPFYM